MSDSAFTDLFKNQIAGKRPPYWFMRQAGRYLPEYRQMRTKFSNFLEFCYTPEAACAVTLQPIERFDCDAAILFSDILVIPDALGQPVSFQQGEGPILEALKDDKAISNLSLERIESHLSAVYEAVSLIRQNLDKHKILIGFSGAPWTLMCYMLQGKGSKEFDIARQWMYHSPEAFSQLQTMVIQAVIRHCLSQIKAGADMIQLFDSWAGLLNIDAFTQSVIHPTRDIVSAIKLQYPHIPIVGFPKGAGKMVEAYAKETGVDIVAVDASQPIAQLAEAYPSIIWQGNLDNMVLASSEQQTRLQTTKLVTEMKNKPYIFNLGHGILPHTPIAHVEAMVETIRKGA